MARDLPETVAIEYQNLSVKLDFNKEVKPILSDKCFSCHGPDQAKQKAGLRLDEPEGAYRELENSPGKFAIRPGNLQSSEVFHRILSEDPELVMPALESNLSLTNREKAILIKWIEEGAVYKPHWAFQKSNKVFPPKIQTQYEEWVQNPIDPFISEKWEEEKMTPSPLASKELLLRRLSFDLTGLPPTEEEMNDYLEDTSPYAYEKQVDRLLASPHYGEKMAIDWLDLARYSDTHGYTVDYYRDVSPWRDWVIQSFNQNMRYDKFIQWQLAGDLMPNPTQEQILATTFNRLHPQNLEDGIIDEEYRVEYVVDRTSVLGTAFMGLTVACARCHDHKYDPISQKNFYELYSFFNNINEAGLIPRESSTPVPTLLLPNKKQDSIIAYLESLFEENQNQLSSVEKQEEVHANEWIAARSFKGIAAGLPSHGLIAHYSLDTHLRNELRPQQKGKMDRMRSKGERPSFTQGHTGKGLLMDGDAWLDLDEVGVFQRKDPFSIGIWVNIPEQLEEGVIFHKGKGTGLHAYRGYHLYLRENKLELMLSHTAPDNAIIQYTAENIPKDEWIHLLLTYDGSSRASGVTLYQNGKKMDRETTIDNLYKDMVFFNYEDVIYPEPIETRSANWSPMERRGDKGGKGGRSNRI